MIEKILEFMKSAAHKAVAMQKSIDFAFKDKTAVFSVVTAADRAISQMFAEFVHTNFAALNYKIVDEETLGELGKDKFAILDAAEYLFVIDPIDGTHPYALRMPEYAISVGVLKNGKPYLGAIIAPVTGELVYYDGKSVFWQQEALSVMPPVPLQLEKSPSPQLAMIFGNEWFVEANCHLNPRQDTVISLYAAVLHLIYIATNRAKGYYFGSYLWDMAGAWGALHALGIDFYEYQSGTVVSAFSPEFFTPELKIKNISIVCRQEDFSHLREIVDLKKHGAI